MADHIQQPTNKPQKQPRQGLNHLDLRTTNAKRYFALYKALDAQSPLKSGHGKSALVAQGASLTLAYESLTAELIKGKPKADSLVRVANVLNRVLSALGIVSWADGPPVTHQTKPDFKRLHDPNNWKKE